MLDALSYEKLAAEVGTNFLITDTPDPVELKFIKITECRGNERQEYFSLFFHGAPEFVLPQKIYALRHETLGVGELFLVPVGRTDQGVEYEAAFNRLIDDKKA